MTIGLFIAGTGLDAMQTAMDTVAQNLSNASTPGYVSESAALVANPDTNALGVGGGVSVAAITQANSPLLTANVVQTQGALSQATSLQQVLNGAQAVFPEPSSSGLAQQLSNFWQTWDSLAQSPSSPAPYNEVVDVAQNLVSSLHSASGQLTNLQNNSQTQLSSTVTQANTLLAQVASLNGQITATAGNGASPNSLIDQQNQVIQNLAQLVGVTVTPGPGGTANVEIGGIDLVQGTIAQTLAVQGAPGSETLATASGGATVPTSGGVAAGLLAAINQYLPSYQNQLDGVANALASTVNGQLAAGYTTTGQPGSASPLFTGSGAAGLSVNPSVVANPESIAASSTATLPAASNNGGNAQAMAQLFNSPTGPDQTYQSLIEVLGSQVQSVNNQVHSQTSVANAAQQQLQAATGVNPDTQMVTLLNLQQTYQAAAKVIQTIDTALQSLLNTVP